MRFLLDVHIATSIARALEESGYDVLRAAIGHADWSDERLLELAVGENRVLITQDHDFSDLIFRDGADAPPSVLYLRSNAAAQPALVDRILMVIANTSIDDHMVVIQQAGIRYRPLPEKSSDNG